MRSITTTLFLLAGVLTAHAARLQKRAVSPVSSGLPEPWKYVACYVDNAHGRVFEHPAGASPSTTIESCVGTCKGQGYSVAGLEYANECYCGNRLINGAQVVPDADCYMGCAGRDTEACGGPNRLSVHSANDKVDSEPYVVAAPATSGLPDSWKYGGCYVDNAQDRILNPVGVPGALTIKSCISACRDQGLTYAGTEYSRECYCGSKLDNGAKLADEKDCNMACDGNPAEACGGPNRMSVYTSSGTAAPPPTTTTDTPSPPNPTFGPVSNGLPGNWTYSGCYTDNPASRSLSNNGGASGTRTIQNCIDTCSSRGYKLAGTEYSQECFCGDTLQNGARLATEDTCNMGCSGNPSQACGGPNRLSIYATSSDSAPTPPNPPASTTTSTSSPGATGIPEPWTYAACYIDNAHGRVLEQGFPASPTNSIESCISRCSELEYKLAGTQYSSECWCGNKLVNGAEIAPEADCNMDCTGNTSEKCGSGNRLSLYTATGNVRSFPVPAAQTTGLTGNWSYAGCFREIPTRLFAWQLPDQQNTTVVGCTEQCSKFGYTASGLEYGGECYCGDIEDLKTTTSAPEADCNTACTGDGYHVCGGAQRLSTYIWNGTLADWKRPENTGRYEFFMPGLVVPLIATLGINDKVTFLEKWGTGAPNTTGAYELDLTLTNDFGKAYREMNVKTDVFCAGSIILPDSKGRQINVGGWSDDSAHGLRLYTPSGSDGVNGTTDWEENVEVLRLRVPRWYPTAMTMTNGSILVIGGEVGSNGAPQPNLEILPRPADGYLLDLEWLRVTDPYNLYPFLVVLPSGGIFVAYWNEARILDPVTFDTRKILPKIPGSVADLRGGRTYPLEGAMMLMPQIPPYDVLRVLMCGGATPGFVALDNCVSIEPDAANPEWVIERMPSRRVMSNMAPLADGTYMILNGAKDGQAGFGLASNPNLQAILYDPFQPYNQRISILNSTIVARMYHSEAILLPDGRVLVSGSNPETPGLPEEHRIEVYVPPYLNEGHRQPEFTIDNKDWDYGQEVTFTPRLFQGLVSRVKVTLIAAMSSTHGNTMGARTIMPAVSCIGTTCTVTAPPNANVSPPAWYQMFIVEGRTPSKSQWVRIGGDPGHLGAWPNLPGFTPPDL